MLSATVRPGLAASNTMFPSTSFVLRLLLGLLFVLRTADGVATTQAMGFHEGARRNVRCDGGYITGFDVHFGRFMGFAELTVVGVRVKCSSGNINVEYAGSTSDDHIFGNLDPGTVMLTADCPKGTGVAAIAWRRASSSEKDHTTRIGGMKVHCSTEESAQPIIVDATGVDRDFPVALKCSETSSPPKGDKVRLTGVEVWFEQMFSGLHLLECELEKS